MNTNISKKIFSLLILSGLVFTNTFAMNKYFTQKSLGELIPGRQNEEIKMLQQSLYDFGYYRSDDDEPVMSGKFENDLFLALKDFQKTNKDPKNGIRETGRADYPTLKVLNEFIKFQDDSLKKQEQEDAANGTSEKSTLNKNDTVDKYSDSKDYVTDEKNYFDDGKDSVNAYTNQQKKLSEENKPKQASVIGGIMSSILNFFIPSEKYRDNARAEFDTVEFKTRQDKVVRKNKFENYDLLQCTQDDECIKFMEDKNK